MAIPGFDDFWSLTKPLRMTKKEIWLKNDNNLFSLDFKFQQLLILQLTEFCLFSNLEKADLKQHKYLKDI